MAVRLEGRTVIEKAASCDLDHSRVANRSRCNKPREVLLSFLLSGPCLDHRIHSPRSTIVKRTVRPQKKGGSLSTPALLHCVRDGLGGDSTRAATRGEANETETNDHHRPASGLRHLGGNIDATSEQLVVESNISYLNKVIAHT